MVIIKFPNGNCWSKANWVFRQLSEDVIGNLPDDSELKLVMEKALAFRMLALNSMENEVRSKSLCAIRTIVEKTLEGKIAGWKESRPDDIEGHRMYIESITELLGLIKEQMGGQK
jgi:hypothetical protein